MRIWFFKGSPLRKAWLFLFLFFNLISTVLGQDRSGIVPQYNFINKFDLPTVSATSLNTEDLTIAIATGPDNFVYTLTFGNGVQKRNPDGSIVNSNFITGLDSPLDIAVDEDGLIYIADFQAGGTTYEDNGQIKIFDSNGNYLSSILTSYFRPLGIDVDSENVYIAEYNDGQQGPESTPSSRVRIVSKTTRTAVAVNNNVIIPFRIAVDSNKNVYVSQAGNNSPAVLIFNSNLSFQGSLTNIQSPGSVVVDSFDYIHVIEYAGRIDFSRFIYFEDLSFGEIQDIAEDIDNGQDANAFGIKVFKPDRTLQYTFKQQIDFPVDLAFNNCDRMYVDNSTVFGGNIIFVGYVPSRIEFDLEFYKRTPSADITPPIALCIGELGIEISGNETVIITLTDIDNGSSDLCGNVTLSLDKTSFTAADEGANTVTLTVTDEVGNFSTCTATVNVTVNRPEDTEDPVITCPDDISKNIDAGQCGAIVTFSAATATDNSGSVEISRTDTTGLNSGDLFPVGETMISFRAIDDAGNFSECSFTIMVTDNEDPEILTCPGNISESVAYGASGKEVNYALPTFDDNCNGATIVQTEGYPAGSEFPVGETTNTFVVTDAAGNTSECSFVVTIIEEEDSEDPVFTFCPGDQILTTGSENCEATVNYQLPEATDNSGSFSLELIAGIAPGEAISTGTTTITYRATDAVGNSAECSFDIQVQDQTRPVITNCPENIEINLGEGETYILPDFTQQASASDNCGILDFRQDIPAGTEYTEEGIIEITLTAGDVNSHSTNCPFRITITREEPVLPFSCRNSVSVQLGADGTYQLNYEDLIEVNGDISAYQFVVSRSIMDCDDTSEIQTVTLLYTGPQNGSCDVEVNVLDVIDPEIQCLADIVETVPFGSSGKIVDYTITGNDNCSSTTIEQTAGLPSGSEFPVGETITNSFRVIDNAGNIAECSFTVTITEDPDTNESPVANPDAYTTEFETTLTIEAPGVLSNDEDPDGDELSASIASPPTDGTLTLNGDGSFTYVPNAGFSGADTFTYFAFDGSVQAEGTVSIVVVLNPNGTPIATDDFYSTNQDESLVVPNPGILANDSDPQDRTLVPTITETTTNGVLTLNDDGSFTYVPNSGFSGSDSFEYRVSNGNENSEVATVTISVIPSPNEPPVANPDTYSTAFETVLTVASPGVLGNDEDPEGDSLATILIEGVTNGTLQFNEDGSFIYTPVSGFSGEDSLSYIIDDGSNFSNEVDVTIIVAQQSNQAPIANDDNYSINANQTLEIGAPGILENDIDANEDPLTADLISDVNNGNLIFNSNGSFTYTPNADYSGPDSFTYVASDGEFNSNIVTVSINVLATLSLSCPDFYNILADENCSYIVPDFSEILEFSPANASFNQSISAGTQISQNTNIRITVSYENEESTCIFELITKDDIDPIISCIGDQVGVNEGEGYLLPDYREQLTTSDNCSEVTIIQVPSPNTRIFEDVQITFIANDASGNSDSCNFDLDIITPGELAVECPNDRSVSYNENCVFEVPDYTDQAVILNGENAQITQDPEPGTLITEDQFEVTLNVSQGTQTANCSFTVSVIDTLLPVAACVGNYEITINPSEAYILNPLEIDNGSFDNCGEVSLNLDKSEFTASDEGDNSVQLIVEDASGNISSCTTIVRVTVSEENINQPPVGINEEYSTTVNTSLSVNVDDGVLANDSDPDGDPITANLVEATANGTLDLNADGSFIYIPDAGFVGQDYFTYVANDGEDDSNIVYVTINVEAESGDFGCNAHLVVGLGPGGEVQLNIEQLYFGDAEGLNLSADKLLFDCEDIGDNIVTLSYSGRIEGTCEIPVTVVDDSSPVLQLKDISIDLDLAGSASISFGDIDNGSFDGCDEEVVYTLDKTVFSCKDLGQNTVLVTAKDESGNVITSTATVTVFAEAGICSDPLPGSEYIFIYPNPNSGSFQVATPQDVSISRIEVFDHRGRYITSRNYPEGSSVYAMELGPLQEAVYVVKISTNEGDFVKRMIFKN